MLASVPTAPVCSATDFLNPSSELATKLRSLTKTFAEISQHSHQTLLAAKTQQKQQKIGGGGALPELVMDGAGVDDDVIWHQLMGRNKKLNRTVSKRLKGIKKHVAELEKELEMNGSGDDGDDADDGQLSDDNKMPNQNQDNNSDNNDSAADGSDDSDGFGVDNDNDDDNDGDDGSDDNNDDDADNNDDDDNDDDDQLAAVQSHGFGGEDVDHPLHKQMRQRADDDDNDGDDGDDGDGGDGGDGGVDDEEITAAKLVLEADGMFSLDDMESFLEQEDNKEEKLIAWENRHPEIAGRNNKTTQSNQQSIENWYSDSEESDNDDNSKKRNRKNDGSQSDEDDNDNNDDDGFANFGSDDDDERDLRLFGGFGSGFGNKNDDDDDEIEDLVATDILNGWTPTNEASRYKYNDFFDPMQKTNKTVARKSENDDQSSEDDNNQNIDSYDSDSDDNDAQKPAKKKQKKSPAVSAQAEPSSKLPANVTTKAQRKEMAMAQRIKKLEDLSLKKKTWELMGEADAKMRPTNSLLNTTLEFEHQTRAPAPITEETTQALERIIRDRIKSHAFDDVVRIIPKDLERFRPKRELLDHEKSKVGLAEQYEKEFARQVLGQRPVDTLKQAHNELQEVWEKLCSKLDALTHFHFAPNRTDVEISVKPNVAAMNLEEAMPEAMNTSSGVAPEEVFASKLRGLPSENEMTREDRKRKRNTHKRRAVDKKKKDAVIANKVVGKKQSIADAQAKLHREGGRNVVVADNNATSANADSTKYTKSTQFFAKVQQGGEPAKKLSDSKKSSAWQLRL